MDIEGEVFSVLAMQKRLEDVHLGVGAALRVLGLLGIGALCH